MTRATAPAKRLTSSRGKLPDFLIIGAMRSGTTSLARYLGAHPGVFMAVQKEVHFFDQEFDRGTAWYRSHFPVEGHLIVGEATQTYMFDALAPVRMAAVVPEARLIAILRDPVERAYSHYHMIRALGGETRSFREAVGFEDERLAAGDPVMSRRYSYVARGLYLRQLLHVCRWFPRDQLRVVLFEDLRDRPIDTYSSLCRWLGLEPLLPTNLGTRINAHVRFRSRRLRSLARRLPRLPQRLVGALNAYEAQYPPMDPLIRSELGRRFAGPNEELGRWLDRDLSMWSG